MAGSVPGQDRLTPPFNAWLACTPELTEMSLGVAAAAHSRLGWSRGSREWRRRSIELERKRIRNSHPWRAGRRRRERGEP